MRCHECNYRTAEIVCPSCQKSFCCGRCLVSHDHKVHLTQKAFMATVIIPGSLVALFLGALAVFTCFL